MASSLLPNHLCHLHNWNCAMGSMQSPFLVSSGSSGLSLITGRECCERQKCIGAREENTKQFLSRLFFVVSEKTTILLIYCVCMSMHT